MTILQKALHQNPENVLSSIAVLTKLRTRKDFQMDELICDIV